MTSFCVTYHHNQDDADELGRQVLDCIVARGNQTKQIACDECM